MRLRWKRTPKETGLRSVGSPPRGYIYHDGENEYAEIYASGGGWRSKQNGWYWVAGWGENMPHKNTCATPVATVEEAKSQASTYVKEYLK